MTAIGSPVHDLPIPVIETDRLILRAPRGADFAAIAAFSADPVRTQFIGGAQTQTMDVWRGFMSVIGHWMWRGYGFWSVEEKATGALVGRVGLINHPDWPEPELGWHVFAEAEGRGIAYEAAMAARRYAADHLGLPRLISLIDPANTRSRALADRMGAQVETEFEVLGKPCLIYRHPDPREVSDAA